ncbi:MAG: hypothetical protein U9N04_03010 [Patescibacteria group bacterium]|nr:hypothetical protein [Patescibacteria group bacterium]
MSKNLKIQTMNDDLDELKDGSQKPFQETKEKKKKEKTIVKTVGASGATEQVNPKRSVVESVINSMANGKIEIGKEKWKKSETKEVKQKERIKPEGKNIDELQNLVSRISETIPEKKEALDQEKLPKSNIEPASRKTKEEINKEIDREMEARINKEKEEKTKSETEVATAADLEINKNVDFDKKEEKNQKNGDVEKLRSLINRISKTAEKGDAKKEILKKTDAIPKKEFQEVKKEEIKNSAVLDSKKNNVARMPLAGKIQEKSSSKFSGGDMKSAIDHDKSEEQEKKSFWNNISEKLKKGDNQKKIKEIKTLQEKKMPKDKVEKSDKSGILFKNDKKEKKIQEKKDLYSKNDKYILPENRLIHGKQKFYSSVSKRIKSRKDKGEMEGLKNVADIKKKKKILSREEEYKKLKKSIISKYHVKLFQLPWKKIISISLIMILMISVSFYFVMSVLVPKPPPPLIPDTIFREELSEFMNIEKKITIAESSLRGFNNLETDARDIFNVNFKLKVIKLVIVNTEDKENRNILALNNSLNAFGIDESNLPENFLEMSADKYSFFIFKTKDNNLRYGIAIGLKDRYLMSEIMREWEKERSVNKKMITILKPLFASDKNYGDIYKSFSSADYGGVEVRYTHLIDENTALNYFIYNSSVEDGNDLLVITTSKGDAHTIIDLLADNQ